MKAPALLRAWLPQVADSDDAEMEHGKACDDMWTLDLTKLAVRDVPLKRGDIQGSILSSMECLPLPAIYLVKHRNVQGLIYVVKHREFTTTSIGILRNFQG